MGIFDWFKKQAKKEDIDLKTDGDHVSVSALVTKKEAIGISPEDAQAMQAEIMTFLNESDEDKAFNFACQLLAKGNYQGCIVAFEKIMAERPEKKGDCENQIGAAHFFLGDNQEAVKHYLLALDNGFDANMLDYNVWEAAEEHENTTTDKSLVQVYLDRFPEGEHVKAAKKLL